MRCSSPADLVSFRVLNLAEARFDCTFGRGCDGVCCRNGRPLIYPDEIAGIDGALDAVVPLLRPTAARVVNRDGYLSNRRKRGERVVRVVDGWCVFFNNGCTLHMAGAAEGDPLKYKPTVCALFPLDRNYDDSWYVRQKGYKGEIWQLHCLDPQNTAVPAADSLRAEIAIVERITAAQSQQHSK